jgi:dipeptidyl aminopeptidase/acylaminoacyl peptidase
VTSARPRRQVREPGREGPSERVAAPGISLVGLIVAAVVTYSLLTGDVTIPGGGNGGGPDDGPPRTPAPSGHGIVDPRTDVPGSIVYVKAGNVWVQSGKVAAQVTAAGGASDPSWSSDGQWIYYIETTLEFSRFPIQGTPRRYELHVPALMRVRPDGSGAETLATGRYTTPNGAAWFYWIREPVASPDGRRLALTSDGPNPLQSDVVLQLFDLETRTFSKPDIPETEPLGHQDPVWRSDGLVVYYVRNDRDGANGRPAIFNLDTTTGRVRPTGGPGYFGPSLSPDSRYLAATKTDAFGTDVVILDLNGGELLRVTSDGRSWSPAWSPKGDAIAFLHLAGGIVDLRMVPLEGAGPSWTAGEAINLTEVSGLDGGSAPRWFIPADQLPPPTAPPATPTPDAGGSAAPSS